MQILFAKASQASAWFNPELLAIPLPTVQEWMAANPELAVYRFAIEDLYRQQEHVLDDKGEHLLSLSSRFSSAPVRRLRRAVDRRRQAPDAPPVERRRGHADLRAVPRHPRDQPQPGAIAPRRSSSYHKLFEANVNTYASLYNGVLQRDWFHAQARGYRSTLDAALHGNNIPTTVVENLIETTKAGTEPLRRYHRLRKRVLGLETYHTYDTTIPLVDFDREVSVRGRARVAAGVGRAARRRVPAAACARRSTAGGSTSTRTRASGAARTRRRSTASTRTCC